jgi:hypothetical protein
MKFTHITHLGEKPFGFTQNGLVCTYDPCKKEAYYSSITFKTTTGATVRLDYSSWNDSIAAYVNGVILWEGGDSAKIKEPKLRAAVEAGANAWALESIALSKRLSQERVDALKSL